MAERPEETEDKGRVVLPSPDELDQLLREIAALQRNDVQAGTPQEPTDARRSDAAMAVVRGVVAEVALFNEALRYPWSSMRRAYHVLIDACVDQYIAQLHAGNEDDETRILVGVPQEKVAAVDTEDDTAEIVIHPHDIDRAKAEVHELLDRFEEGAPFTVQRLSEIVLEPQKQYASLDKFMNALEVVLSVTSLHVGNARVDRSEIGAADVSRVND